MPNFLDALLSGFLIQSNGTALPKRRTLNVGAGLAAADDPTNDRTNLTSLAGARHVVADDDDLDFAGTPGFGDVDIFATTIVSSTVTDTVTWDFFADGVSEGWTVFFDVRGPNGIVGIRNGGEDNPFMVLDTNATAQMRAIYFDGTTWKPLSTGAGDDGALHLPTHITSGSPYTVDSRTVKDCLLLVDATASAVTVNLPPHDLGRLIIIKLWKSSGGHGITVHRNGGTGKINSVPADLALSTLRDYSWLLSDGVDNWLDLIITGT